MKRVISLIFLLCMLALSLAACDISNDSDVSNTSVDADQSSKESINESGVDNSGEESGEESIDENTVSDDGDLNIGDDEILSEREFNTLIDLYDGYDSGGYYRYELCDLGAIEDQCNVDINQVVKNNLKQKFELLDGYYAIYDEEYKRYYYFIDGEYNGKAYTFLNYGYNYEQLPWIYYYLKKYNDEIVKEDFVRYGEQYSGIIYTEKEIEVMFSFDDEAVRRELKLDEVFYYSGRLYGLPELLIMDKVKLKEMAKNGELQEFLEDLKAIATDKNGALNREHRELICKCANYLRMQIEE